MQAVFSRVTDPPNVSLASFPLFGENKTCTRRKVGFWFPDIIKQRNMYPHPWDYFYNGGECVSKQRQQQKLWDTPCTFLRHIIIGFFDKKPNHLPALSLSLQEKKNKIKTLMNLTQVTDFTIVFLHNCRGRGLRRVRLHADNKSATFNFILI